MKKKLYALSGVLLIVLVITGLWAAKAVSFMGVAQTGDSAATQSAGVSIQSMTQGASLIVVGTVLETRSEWIDRRLVTRATVLVAESLKGAAPEKVVVLLPGGIDAKRKFPVAMTYAGAPTMSPDEEVALFLVPAQDEVANAYAVMSYAEGKFSIAQTTTGEKVVTRDMTKAPMQKGPGLTRGNPKAVQLSEFKELVRSYLK
ncbi:MAG TPA: hypothetical protein VFS27_07100 [Blastocatellia bacterium]|jgi:hypothetical protein|nr:hypothetical protein [Blastocatellia bacterium]